MHGDWLALSKTIPSFHSRDEEYFENIVRNGGNASDQHFPLVPQCFLQVPQKFNVLVTFGLSSATDLNLDSPLFLSLGKLLKC